MTQIRTSPRGTKEPTSTGGDALTRALIVAKYVILTVCGVILYHVATAYALAERGYTAVGGELFFLLLPVIYYAVSTAVRDFINDLRTGFTPNYKEDNK